MKKFGWSTRFMAIALSAVIAASAGTAVADEILIEDITLGSESKKSLDWEVDLGKDEASGGEYVDTNAEIVAVKGNAVYVTQTDGESTINFVFTVPDEWITPEGDGVAYGWLDKVLKVGGIIWDKLTDGGGDGGGGGGGGGNTNTCNVNVTGADVVVIGNLNCGGTQTGTGGTGTGTGGGGSGGTRPQ